MESPVQDPLNDTLSNIFVLQEQSCHVSKDDSDIRINKSVQKALEEEIKKN